MPPSVRPDASKLEKTLAGTKAAKDIAGAVLPAFQSEDLGKHVEYLLKEDAIVAHYVERNPLYKKTLEDITKSLYDTKYAKYMTSAKFIDSADRVLTGLTALGQVVPVIGQGVRAITNTVELVPKTIYAAWYASGTNDYAALPYFAAMEAASFIPVVGELIDLSNMYISRARKTFRKRVAEEFLRQVAQKSTDTTNNDNDVLPKAA